MRLAWLLWLSVLVVVASTSLPTWASDHDDSNGNLFEGPQQDPGATWNRTFDATGHFEYHCHPHPWMLGSITVVEADGHELPQTHVVRIVEPEGEDSEAWRFDPMELELHVGDTVRWDNDGAVMHQVMGFRTGDGDVHTHDHGDGGHGTTAESPLPAWSAALAVTLAALALTRRR